MVPDATRRERFVCAFKILVQQLVKGMSGAVPVENFSRPIVEQRLHPLDLTPRDAIEARPAGKNCRRRPLVFSFVPRSHGHCGWAKYTFIFVCLVNKRCSRISWPWS